MGSWPVPPATRSGGALGSAVSSQSGKLVGPRPPRPPMSDFPVFCGLQVAYLRPEEPIAGETGFFGREQLAPPHPQGGMGSSGECCKLATILRLKGPQIAARGTIGLDKIERVGWALFLQLCKDFDGHCASFCPSALAELSVDTCTAVDRLKRVK